MKSMKGLSVSRVMGRRGGSPSNAEPVNGTPPPGSETPEATAARAVRSFCESGGPGREQGEEVLFLPTIVESAESSPAAAAECARVIRKYLSKDHYSQPHTQYNGIMLVRILTDNPGKTFTKNMDAKFVVTLKELLRNGRDPSVKQILIETLDNFEREKKDDENLIPVVEMWAKEQVKMAKIFGPKGPPAIQQYNNGGQTNDHHSQNYFSRSHNQSRRLPPPVELASRIEEARTSAKLLAQVIQSTPPDEILNNELIHEFADRCLSASRSIQSYMVADEPAPDNETMLTLIETNEQLGMAMSKHQRAVLNSRKAMGIGNEPGVSPGNRQQASLPSPGNIPPPQGPPPQQADASSFQSQESKSKPTSRKGLGGFLGRKKDKKSTSEEQTAQVLSNSAPVVPPKRDPAVGVPPVAAATPSPPSTEHPEDPFRDPKVDPPQGPPPGNRGLEDEFSGLSVEPYHPGFNPTKSYMGRQDSSLNNATMHAAVIRGEDEDDEDDEDDMRRPAVAQAPATTQAPRFAY